MGETERKRVGETERKREGETERCPQHPGSKPTERRGINLSRLCEAQSQNFA